MKSTNTFDPKNIIELLQNLAKTHPEHATLIDAFSPLTIAREQLLHEYALKRKPATSGTKPAILLENIPLCPTKCGKIAQEVVKALGQGFKESKAKFDLVGKQFLATPSAVRRLTKQSLLGNNQALEKFAEKNKLSEDILTLVIIQVAQIMTARVTRAIPTIENPEVNDTLCPYCGARPSLSVIYEKEGKRDLLCSYCSQTWRYSRSSCSLCAMEAPKNLHHIYKEGSPHERAVTCQNCNHYILESDIRNSSVSPIESQPMALVLGYLDVLAQEEGFIPVSSIPPNANVPLGDEAKKNVQ